MALSTTVELRGVLAYPDCLGAPAVGFIALKISTKHLVASKLSYFFKSVFRDRLLPTLSLLGRSTVAVST